jgi:hypothetical protein
MLSAFIPRKMPAEEMEMLAFRILFNHGAWTHREAGADFNILQLVLARRQCLVENIGLANRGSVIKPHAGFDEACTVFREMFPQAWWALD